MSYEVKGKLIVKSDEHQITERFKKREFVIDTDTDTDYPQQIKFQLTQDRCSLLDNYDLNDEINVHFNLKGRGYQKNGETIYFTNLEAWKLEKVAGLQPEPTQDAPTEVETADTDIDPDNLPF